MPKLDFKKLAEIHEGKIKERKEKVLEAYGINEVNEDRRTRTAYNPRLATWGLFIDGELSYAWQTYKQSMTN